MDEAGRAISKSQGTSTPPAQTSELEFRPALKSDLPEVLRLYAEADLDHGTALPLAEAERIFEQMQRYPNYQVYLARSGGTVVGTFALLIMENLGHFGTPSGVIEDVAVPPSHQSRGIGRAMMAHAIEICRRQGCYKMVLSSNLRRERAHAFYDALDFERHGYSFRITPA